MQAIRWAISSTAPSTNKSPLTSPDSRLKLNHFNNNHYYSFFLLLQAGIGQQLQTIFATIDKSASETGMFVSLCETASKMIIREIQDTLDKVKVFFTKSSETNLLNNYYGVLMQKIEVRLQRFFLSLSILMLVCEKKKKKTIFEHYNNINARITSTLQRRRQTEKLRNPRRSN